MKIVFVRAIPVTILALCATGLTARAQGNSNVCGASQSLAVKCYVRYALETGTTNVPAGMSMQQYQAYGVAVLRILQSGHTYFMVLGASAAISDAMPPGNNDGSANQAAQDAAVNSIIDAALTNGLITLPNSVTEAQVQEFARDTTDKMDSETYILQHGHYQIEVMANLDKVPPTGAVIVVSWPKVQNGLGFPARAFAILP